MASVGNRFYARADKIRELAKAPLSINFKGKYLLVLIADSLVSEIRFRANQIRHWASTQTVTSQQPHINHIDRLDYFVGRDETGLLRGGEIPWHYMQGLSDDQRTPDEKRRQLRRTLAQLPSNVSFIFKADPQIRDQDAVRRAFADAGFANRPRTTLIYHGKPGIDPIDAMKPDARTKIRKARRELEFTTMDVDSFFDHYRENLNGRESHFFLNIDQELIRQAVHAKNPQAEILAVRRKQDDSGKQQPIEAALVCSTGTDGYCKLLRISFRRAAEPDSAPPPHQQALKMLVVEAMQRAANRGLPLDVDGFTRGGSTLYSRFGLFQEVVHDHFERMTPGAAITQLARRVADKLNGP